MVVTHSLGINKLSIAYKQGRDHNFPNVARVLKQATISS
jgi:hypothetical protein